MARPPVATRFKWVRFPPASLNTVSTNYVSGKALAAGSLPQRNPSQAEQTNHHRDLRTTSSFGRVLEQMHKLFLQILKFLKSSPKNH